jgi:hypothetical protein
VKNLLCYFLFSGIFLSAYSQSSSSKQNIDLSAHEWIQLIAENGLTVEYKFNECTPSIGYKKENAFLKFTNTSASVLTISWHAHLYYNGVCKTCSYPEEYSYSLTLQPGESLEGDCSENYDNRVIIFSRYLDERYTGGSSLTDFKLSNLSVTIQK